MMLSQMLSFTTHPSKTCYCYFGIPKNLYIRVTAFYLSNRDAHGCSGSVYGAMRTSCIFISDLYSLVMSQLPEFYCLKLAPICIDPTSRLSCATTHDKTLNNYVQDFMFNMLQIHACIQNSTIIIIYENWYILVTVTSIQDYWSQLHQHIMWQKCKCVGGTEQVRVVDPKSQVLAVAIGLSDWAVVCQSTQLRLLWSGWQQHWRSTVCTTLHRVIVGMYYKDPPHCQEWLGYRRVWVQDEHWKKVIETSWGLKEPPV